MSTEGLGIGAALDRITELEERVDMLEGLLSTMRGALAVAFGLDPLATSLACAHCDGEATFHYCDKHAPAPLVKP